MKELLKWILDMLEQLPSGIDLNADINNQCPEDSSAHIGGLIYQEINEFLRKNK